MAVHPRAPLISHVDHTRSSEAHCLTRGTWEADVRAALPWPIATALLRVPALTRRELTAFRLLGVGYDNHSIARRMSISERTAKRHVTAILIKLGLKSRLQAGLAAMAMALLAAGPTYYCGAAATVE